MSTMQEEMHMEMVMEVQKAALTPLGGSLAAAIIVCVIYFLFDCLAVWNFIVTKYSWYDIVIISATFRTVAIACKAAYLAHYSPALQGTFLAFFNAGFAASGAAMWVTLGVWFSNKGVVLFSEKGDKIAKVFCYLMIIPVAAFGPVLGVVAAGLIYGAWRTAPHAAYLGARCRRASTYGILGVFAILLLFLLIVVIKLFFVLRQRKRSGVAQKVTSKRPDLIWVFIVVTLVALIRACTGVVALYKTKRFVWNSDHYFYTLDTLPDYVVLLILTWPKLLARISCTYPSEPSTDLETGDSKAVGSSAVR